MEDSSIAIRAAQIVRAPIASSAVISVGYDADSAVFECEYQPRKDGSLSVFRYQPISPEWFAELTSGTVSAGGMIHKMIKSRETMIVKVS